MAGLLFDAVATTLSTGSETLQTSALVNEDAGDTQGVDVSAFVVLALAIADSSTFLMITAPFFGEKARIFSAWATD